MGAASGEVMKWNGTAWVASAENPGSAVVDTDTNDGLTDFDPAAGYDVNVDNATIELNADGLRVKNGGITTAQNGPDGSGQRTGP